MDITYPQTLIQSLKRKHLLIDSNIFRDSANFPNDFGAFFNILKTEDVTIATLDIVKYEMLKGSANKDKYKSREKQINDIVDVTLPLQPQTNSLVYDLIKEYGIDGSSMGIADLFLGAILKQYKTNIFLMTRDTTDFIQSIFELKFIVNGSHKKGIFTYGIFQYTSGG